jgi:predicted transcriptional regulator
MKRRAMGALEREVLARLWASDEALTPAEVASGMNSPPAYTTVMTILTRLWRKQILTREGRGRAYAYRPLLSEGEFAARQMRASFEAASNREEALSHFVGTLSKREERALRRVIAELDR